MLELRVSSTTATTAYEPTTYPNASRLQCIDNINQPVPSYSECIVVICPLSTMGLIVLGYQYSKRLVNDSRHLTHATGLAPLRWKAEL